MADRLTKFRIPEMVLGALLSSPLWAVIFSLEVPEFWKKTKDDPASLFTLTLTLATVGLWIAALRQLALSRQTSEQQLRAYVFVSRVQVLNVAEGTGQLESRIRIQNFGQTPAYKVINVDGFAFDDYPKDINLTITDPEFSALGRSKSDLAPTQFEEARNLVKDRTLSAEERQALIDGKKIIYVYGEIRYIDIFGDPHSTKYRYMTGGPLKQISPIGELARCEEGNEAT